VGFFGGHFFYGSVAKPDVFTGFPNKHFVSDGGQKIFFFRTVISF
jgi:hypothetical protein